jgi:predicted nuclease of predicted toxin-antitoxin system
MKFIVDAQLPKRLSHWIQSKEYDAIHTLDLPTQNLTEDLSIIRLSMKEDRVVISKDSDFFEYFILHNEPHKIILLTTGNITNRDLITLFENNFENLISYLEDNKVVELSNDEIIVHF